jgi:hypothetical protein
MTSAAEAIALPSRARGSFLVDCGDVFGCEVFGCEVFGCEVFGFADADADGVLLLVAMWS